MKFESVYPIIITDNPEKFLGFYATLGFTTKFADKTEMGSSVYVIANGNLELEIMETPKDSFVPMSAGLYGIRFVVDDIDAAVETIKQNGGAVVAGPFETESRKVFAVKDVDGNNITLMQYIEK